MLSSHRIQTIVTYQVGASMQGGYLFGRKSRHTPASISTYQVQGNLIGFVRGNPLVTVNDKSKWQLNLILFDKNCNFV